jgi:hypothetical protein
LSEVDPASERDLTPGYAAARPQSLFVATYTIDPTALAARGHQVDADVPHGRILHTVLMKHDSEQYVPFLHQQLVGLTQLDI